MLGKILRKLGLASSRVQAPPEADDQTYTEAVMDNAIRTGDEAIAKLAEATELTRETDERLSEQIERIRRAIEVEPMMALLADVHHLNRKKRRPDAF